MKVGVKWRVGVWVVPLTGAAALAWASLHSEAGSLQAMRAEREKPVRAAAPYPAESLGRIVVEHDPFRIARRPAPVAYSPIGPAPIEASPTPKPVLVLTGIVWGKVPEAVLEGLPQTDGPRVVRQGEVVAGLKIRAIERTHVVVTGLDTLWTLTVREPWH